MGTVFESNDLGEIEDFISAGYTSMRLKARSPGRHHCQLIGNTLGPIGVDRVAFGFDVDFAARPLGTISLVGMESGTFPRMTTRQVDDCYGPGEVFLVAQPEQSFAGRLVQARYSYVSLEPSLLNRVAAAAPGRTDDPVRLTSHRPVSPAAGQQLLRTIAFLRDHVLADPATRDAPLIASTAPQLLAATVLTAFPNTALIEPTISDRHDARPITLRRAAAFVDDHAHLDISVADIAAASHVTIRTLQYAFRRHYGTTPMGYLRRVRLHHAHRELLAADPTSGYTVTQIAARWGFFHPGRFAEHYRASYGHPPHQDLIRRAPVPRTEQIRT